MSQKHRASGEYVSVYLPLPLYLHVQREAARAGLGIGTWIRNAVLDCCPPEIRISSGKIGRGRKAAAPTQTPAKTTAPERAAEAPPPRRQSAAAAKAAAQTAFDALVERSRMDVLALAAKGYRDNAIAAVTRLPYRVVQHITATEAASHKRRKKQ